MAAVVGGNVPDYRGRFLRHVGGNSATLGAAQGDAIRNISGSFNQGLSDHPTITYAIRTCGAAGAFYAPGHSDKVGFSTARGILAADWGVAFNAARVVPTAAENRPVNTAVKYIICAKE